MQQNKNVAHHDSFFSPEVRGLSETTKKCIPSREDRLITLQCVMTAASAIIKANTSFATAEENNSNATSPASSAVKSSLEGTKQSASNQEASLNKGWNEKQEATEQDFTATQAISAQKWSIEEIIAQKLHERRIRFVLREELLRMASSSLLLVSPAGDEKSDWRETPARTPNDPFGCVTLLLTNLILLCGNETGFDARIRHAIKTASIQILSQQMEDEGACGENSCNEDLAFFATYVPTTVEQEDDVTAGKEGPSSMDMKSLSAECIDNSSREKNDQESSANTASSALEEAAVPNSAAEKRRKYFFRKATRKYEAIESKVAQTLWHILLARSQEKKKKEAEDERANSSNRKGGRFIRGLKIASVGLAAGTLLAVTGGVAAPVLVASLSAIGIAGTSAAVASHAFLITVLGVGGGGLASYKMKRRTDGLCEFRIRKESPDNNAEKSKGAITAPEAELHSTVCISGWLNDKFDFQRPWGITPTDPPITAMELLRRFYAVHNPSKVEICKSLQEKYKDRKNVLWKTIKDKYGRDPDHLLPLDGVAEHLSEAENLVIRDLVEISVKVDEAKSQRTTESEKTNKSCTHSQRTDRLPLEQQQVVITDSRQKSGSQQTSTTAEVAERSSSRHEQEKGGTSVPQEVNDKLQSSTSTSGAEFSSIDGHAQNESRVVWDFKSRYRGDLYTITWESDLILKMCDEVKDYSRSLGKNTTKYVLKQTALVTFLSAVAWPATVVSFVNSIDSTWKLAMTRADEAGIELARSLMSSSERRPVKLVGFSSGARAVLSCLKELARQQKTWEERQNFEKEGVGSLALSIDASAIEVGTGSKQDISTTNNESGTVPFVPSREPASIVEDVLLMGTPMFHDRQLWFQCRRVVAGRLINCFSRKDWILSLMFQYKCMSGLFREACGTCPVSDVPCVENLDVSDLVSMHGEYCLVVPKILHRARFDEPRLATD